MNLLLISNVFPPGFVGGYELGALEIARELINRGHRVTVLTSDYFQADRGELLDCHIERSLECTSVSHQLNQSAIDGHYISYRNIRKISSAIRRFPPDAVVAFNLMGLGVLGIIDFMQKLRLPLVLYWMDNVFAGVDVKSATYRRYETVVGKPSFDPPTRVVAMSRNVVAEVSRSLDTKLENVVYIPGWVADSPAANLQIRSGADVRFVYCSQVVAHKGIDLVVDSTAELVRAGLTDLSIDVYGSGQVAALLESVRAKALDRYIRYQGVKPKEEMVSLFANYDALLFPTWEREAFGFVAAESAAAGCFPIMTAGIGAGEWFIDNVDCLKIPRTLEGLEAAMRRTLSMNQSEKVRLRQAALTSARRNLGFKRWMDVIEATLPSPAGAAESRVEFSQQIQSAFLFLSELFSSGGRPS